MKKILLALGSVTTIVAPIAAVISCTDSEVMVDTNYAFSVDGTETSFKDFGHALIREHSLKAGVVIGVGSDKHTLTKEEEAKFAAMTNGNQADALKLVGEITISDKDRRTKFFTLMNDLLANSTHKGQVIKEGAADSSAISLDLIRHLPEGATYTAYGEDATANPTKASAGQRVYYVGDIISDKHATKAPFNVVGHGSMGYHSLFADLKHGETTNKNLAKDDKVVLTVGRFQYKYTFKDADITEYKAMLTKANGLVPTQHDDAAQANAVRWLNKLLNVDDIDRQTVEGWLALGHDGYGETTGVARTKTQDFHVGVWADHHGKVELGGGASHGFHTLFAMFKHPFGDAKYDKNDALIIGDNINFTYEVKGKYYLSTIKLEAADINAMADIHKDSSLTDLPGKLIKYFVDKFVVANTFELSGVTEATPVADLFKNKVAVTSVDDAFKKEILTAVNAWLVVKGSPHTSGTTVTK